jgi:NAD(P)-dependent dehydrogenase (short-subunit alcohol dehydrogenase family)
MKLNSFPAGLRACIFGASGGIGGALVDILSDSPGVGQIYAGVRKPVSHHCDKVTPFHFDLEDETSISAAADLVKTDGPLHLVFIATGVLSTDQLKPEKSWSAQNTDAYARAFAINTTGPAMIGKHFLPLLSRGEKSVFAALSARVGSISDNRLGGWHAYRASKSSLNMVVRNFALELAHRNKSAIAVTLHPGTVNTALSAPFQSGVRPEKLFTPSYSAGQMLHVIDGFSVEDSGNFYAWDGLQIPY